MSEKAREREPGVSGARQRAHRHGMSTGPPPRLRSVLPIGLPPCLPTPQFAMGYELWATAPIPREISVESNVETEGAAGHVALGCCPLDLADRERGCVQTVRYGMQWDNPTVPLSAWSWPVATVHFSAEQTRRG